MNTKAQISDIDLTPDVDLTESRLDILPYKGIMDCNSPHVGGVLNNVYKKKSETLPEGFHKIVEYNGKVYAWKADTEPNIGCKVYDVTDMSNPVVVLDLNSGVEELDTLGFHTVKRELYAKPTETYFIGCLEYNVNGKIYFHNPFKEDDVFFVGNRGDYLNYSIVEDTAYISSISKFNVFSLTGLVEYNSASNINNAIYDYKATSTGHSSPASNARFLVLGGKVFLNFSSFLTTLSTTETILNAVIEENYFTLETKLNSASNGLHKMYWLAGDDPSLVESTDYSSQGMPTTTIPIVVGEDYWDKQFDNSGFIPGYLNNYNLRLNIIKYGSSTVALVINDKVLSYDIDRVIFKDYENEYTYYSDSKGDIYRLSIVTDEAPEFRVINGVIISNSINSVYSSYDMDSETCEEPFFAPEFYLPAIGPDFPSASTMDIWLGSGNNEQWNSNNKKFTALNFPQVHITVAQGLYNKYLYFMEFAPYKSRAYGVNVYSGEDSPTYEFSTRKVNGSLIISSNQDLEGMTFPSYSDGNTVTPVDMFSIIKDSGNNQLLISNSEDKTYISPKNLLGESLFGYYNYTETFMDELFVLQTGIYGIDGDFIYSLQYSNSVLTSQENVANVKGLQYLGAFPLMALFWSELDKSIYIFTGDNNLKKLKEAYRINTVGAIYCDPARLTMFISTDIGLIVLYQEQVFLLDYPLIEGENKIYYDNGKYIVDDDFIAFLPFENAESQTIRIKTEFYGESRMIKSVNDCVFVRITKNSSITSGTVKIKAYTLTEKTSESTEQIYSISEKNFDISGQCLLQYQPQFQTGVGFAVELESDFPVSYMGISHQPEAIQQAPKGKQNVITTPISKPNSSTFKFE